MLTVHELVDQFTLKVAAGNEGLTNEIKNYDISRPALEIGGYFSHYSSDRVQILGMTEISFFERMLTEKEREDRSNLSLIHI